mmetsp:Transcript_12280/g.21568  ORF Transcript_12280/g.21568 Transcript_12280/m.21568 type:complete len:80 (+) Transcript_12280:1633-1872(+)
MLLKINKRREKIKMVSTKPMEIQLQQQRNGYAIATNPTTRQSSKVQQFPVPSNTTSSNSIIQRQRPNNNAQEQSSSALF